MANRNKLFITALFFSFVLQNFFLRRMQNGKKNSSGRASGKCKNVCDNIELMDEKTTSPIIVNIIEL
jgi:hypothetical protein